MPAVRHGGPSGGEHAGRERGFQPDRLHRFVDDGRNLQRFGSGHGVQLDKQQYGDRACSLGQRRYRLLYRHERHERAAHGDHHGDPRDLADDRRGMHGRADYITITVNPVPSVNAVANQTYCNGSAAPSVVFTGNTPGAVFSWSRTNEAIGAIPTSGTGPVPAFTATNAGAAPLTSTFSVVASFFK